MHVTTTRKINAPPAIVLRAVTDIEAFPEIASAVERVEFLSEQRSGAGTRFRETRRQGNSELVTELEVAEQSDRHVRMIADTHGTIWDTTFEVESDGEGSALKVTMEARTRNPIKWLMIRLFRRTMEKSFDAHFADVKAWCERQARL